MKLYKITLNHEQYVTALSQEEAMEYYWECKEDIDEFIDTCTEIVEIEEAQELKEEENKK